MVNEKVLCVSFSLHGITFYDKFFPFRFSILFNGLLNGKVPVLVHVVKLKTKHSIFKPNTTNGKIIRHVYIWPWGRGREMCKNEQSFVGYIVGIFIPGNSSLNNLIKICQRPKFMHEVKLLTIWCTNSSFQLFVKILIEVRLEHCKTSACNLHGSQWRLRVHHNTAGGGLSYWTPVPACTAGDDLLMN